MDRIKFKPGSRVETDDWSSGGESIVDPEKLRAIRMTLETHGPIVVNHRYLRGARAPSTLTFDDYEEFIAYLTEHARAGDAISVWSLWPFMRDTPPLARGKCPDEDGAVPEGGPY